MHCPIQGVSFPTCTRSCCGADCDGGSTKSRSTGDSLVRLRARYCGINCESPPSVSRTHFCFVVAPLAVYPPRYRDHRSHGRSRRQVNAGLVCHMCDTSFGMSYSAFDYVFGGGWIRNYKPFHCVEPCIDYAHIRSHGRCSRAP